ncbi:MAG TPA: hypothetical protein VKA34_16775 [Balneolales bacterium]|nr:hypothetical protein [Balneolales bacterium]
MGFLTFLSSLNDDLLLLSSDKSQRNKGIYGKWKIEKMGPAKALQTPEQSSIVYHFKINNTLTVESSYNNAQRKFHTDKHHINFEGFGLFGSHKKFVYSVSKNTLTLKTEKGFVVKLKRI